jgi:hypothetical protein
MVIEDDCEAIDRLLSSHRGAPLFSIDWLVASRDVLEPALASLAQLQFIPQVKHSTTQLEMGQP